MSLFEKVTKGLNEATKKELSQGGKEYLKAIGGGLLMSFGAYLFSSHAVEYGRHVGRAEILGGLSEATEKLESINEDINKN